VAHPISSISSPVYRPKKLPRVLRRQLPVMRLCAGIVVLGVIVVGVTWRNVQHERLSLDVGIQRTQIETLNKEIQHLGGLIETEASFPKVSQWAREKYGWRPLSNSTQELLVSEEKLTPGARREAKRLEVYP
jgi:sensor domain CHASE-containing protein